MAKLKVQFKEEIAPRLMADLGLQNPMEIPKSPRSLLIWVWVKR